ncbi:unnamed protein product, partial [Laminaria digitata]
MRRVRHIPTTTSKRPPRLQACRLLKQQELAPARYAGSSNYSSFAPHHAQWPLLSLSRCDRSRGRSSSALVSRWQCGRLVSSGKTGAGQSTESGTLMSSNDGKKGKTGDGQSSGSGTLMSSKNGE